VAFNLALARYDHPKVEVGGFIRRSCHLLWGKLLALAQKDHPKPYLEHKRKIR
jgi:hypothetical protein